LKNSFFVGDLLTKRDCHHLQQLAPNTTIINMYGTTETQRAVSYLAIPPRATHPSFLSTMKDVIAAGKGMRSAQLLIINRQSRELCGVGELGEIYVRSGGLAEGYLGLVEATQEKFVDNWLADSGELAALMREQAKPLGPFFKGVRDRLY